MYIGYGMDFHHELNGGAIFVSWCANESGDLNVAVLSFPALKKVFHGIKAMDYEKTAVIYLMQVT